MTLPLARPLTDAEARQCLAVLALWLVARLAYVVAAALAPTAEPLAAIAWQIADCLGNPLCR